MSYERTRVAGFVAFVAIAAVSLAGAGLSACAGGTETSPVGPEGGSTGVGAGGGAAGGSGGSGATGAQGGDGGSGAEGGSGGGTPGDSDGDGVPDVDDPCPNDPNQWTDADGDGYCDEVDDDCPNDPNGHVDTDGDGICDNADECPNDPGGHCDTNGDQICDDNDDCDGDGITNGEEKVYGTDCAISDPDIVDTDGDTIDDPEDAYPRDPFPEYILFRNDSGTIDVMLSNRDGTFQPPVQVAAPHGCTADAPQNCPANPNYRYVGFVISDFDNNGRMDFMAVGDADLSNPNNLRDLWWFSRGQTGTATTFTQRLVDSQLDKWMWHTVADLNNDDRVDLVRMEKVQPGYIDSAALYSYENTGLIGLANCAYTTDVNNPNGCAFIRRLARDVTSIAGGQWIINLSRDAVDVDGDGWRDVVVYTISSGGNVACPTYVLSGNGDGTFDPPGSPMFSHNSGSCGNSPSQSILFADFNNDDIGDIIMGLDDDGDPGSAWFYPGQVQGGNFSFNFAGCAESFDLNPTENGSDEPGATGSARTFDFDFDGNYDVMVGWRYTSATSPPTRTELYLGLGNGSFQAPLIIRDFPTNDYGSAFAIPQRLCTWFNIAP